jgi:hypothetical protein
VYRTSKKDFFSWCSTNTTGHLTVAVTHNPECVRMVMSEMRAADDAVVFLQQRNEHPVVMRSEPRVVRVLLEDARGHVTNQNHLYMQDAIRVAQIASHRARNVRVRSLFRSCLTCRIAKRP